MPCLLQVGTEEDPQRFIIVNDKNSAHVGPSVSYVSGPGLRRSVTLGQGRLSPMVSVRASAVMLVSTMAIAPTLARRNGQTSRSG